MRGDFKRAQFYIRRLNNSELANAETLQKVLDAAHTAGGIGCGSHAATSSATGPIRGTRPGRNA